MTYNNLGMSEVLPEEQMSVTLTALIIMFGI